MRLLLLNPNTTPELTDRLMRSAVTVLPNDVTLIPATASIGFPYISSRSEAQVAGTEVLRIIAEHQGEIDAAVVAAFGDPALSAARELFDIPICGMTEASMLSACSLGETFAFITFSEHLAAWYKEQVVRSGLERRFSGVHTPADSFGNISNVAEDMRTSLLKLCQSVATHSDTLILAGAPIAGLAPQIREEVEAILIDPIQAAVLQAVSLWRLSPRGSNLGSFSRPPAKISTGLPEHLAMWMNKGATQEN